MLKNPRIHKKLTLKLSNKSWFNYPKLKIQFTNQCDFGEMTNAHFLVNYLLANQTSNKLTQI